MENPVWLLWIPLLPWLGALWIGFGILTGARRGEAGERGTARIALGVVGFSLLGMIALDIMALLHGITGQVIFFPWLTSGSFQVTISMLLDRPALVMGSLVAGCGWLTLRFAVNYLHREPGFHRFFAILCLFVGGMEWIALAGNVVLTFIGWEAAGISSYLLIAYAYDRTTATKNATRALMTNRIGDAGFLFAIAMVYLLVGSLEWPVIFAYNEQVASLLVGVMVVGFLVAAMAKSAQMPFVAWISRALEGPTPSSAVFYGALMAHAGAFLVIRLEPLLWRSPFWMVVLMLVGLLTVVYAVIVGRVQSDVKSALIFSTQAQIGLIFAECGAGQFEFALWHLVAHTLWRLYQFLLSPSYIHLAKMRARPVPGWLAHSRTLYDLALHRFWFDSLTDALFTRSTKSLAQETQIFDEMVISRMAGRSVQETLLATRGEWGEQHGEAFAGVTQGRGMLGRSLEQTAKAFFWFEEHLVLSSSGDGLLHALIFFGGYVTRIEQFLSQPRYLFLLIGLTFTIIL